MMYEYKFDGSIEELDGTKKARVYSPMGQKLRNVIPHDYINEKFLKPEQASIEFDKAIDALKDDPESLARVLAKNNAKLLSFENSLLSLINDFGTRGIETEVLNSSANALRTNPEVDKIFSNGNNLTIKLKDGSKIDTMVLSSSVGWENIELETAQRIGKDKEGAIIIAKAFPFESRVVTGKVAGLTSKTSHLHTWVETMIDGKMVVIDYTMNAIMNKSGYEKLRHAEPIATISSADVKEDIPKVAKAIYLGELTKLEYLLYRNKIMEVINENQQ